MNLKSLICEQISIICALLAEVCDPETAAVVHIPNLSFDGISTLPYRGIEGDFGVRVDGTTQGAQTNQAFVSYNCGSQFGSWGVLQHKGAAIAGVANTGSGITTGACLVCKYTTYIYGYFLDQFNVISLHITFAPCSSRSAIHSGCGPWCIINHSEK